MSLDTVISSETSNGRLRVDGVYIADSPNHVTQLMLQGVPANKIQFDGHGSEVFNSLVATFEEFSGPNEHEMKYEWNLPQSYLELDLEEFFAQKLNTHCDGMSAEYIDECFDRVGFELEYFKNCGAETFIRCVIYVIDEFTKRGVFWGIGRGSSCASFCFFLIGLHKVNPILYEIPSSDFFKADSLL